MTCKWAEEGQLSAYLDGTLDPTARAEVESHVEHCTDCTGTLAEFRYFDGLLRDLPRFEPSEHLRSRIFDSPEFADILHSLEHDGAAPPTRGPVFSRPRVRPSGPPASHDRPLEPLPFPTFPAPATLSPTPSGVGRRHGSAPPWVRVAASVAAALVLLAGSALLVKQGFSHSSTVGQQSISGISKAYNPKPLTAGPRVVYLRDGVLWSAPQQGSGAAQRLTPPEVVVGDGWAVSPQRDAVAYIDEATGTLHVVRANDQRDHTVGLGARLVARSTLATVWGTAQGQAILGGLAWSPDGSQIAYLGDPSATGVPTLRVVRADNARAPLTISSMGAGQAAWSPDGVRVAWVQNDSTGQSVWDYNLTTNQARRLGSAGPDATATVSALAWLSADQGPAVTWAATDPASGLVTGVYLSQMPQESDARPLTASGQRFTTAAFSAAQGGLWLLSDTGATYTLAPLAGTLAPIAGLPGGAAAIVWSPDGALAAVLGATGDLRVWARGGHGALVASGVSAGVPLAWSPDGGALAFVSGGQLALAHLRAGTSGSTTLVASLTAVTSIAWSPDGTTFAAGGDDGVTRGLADGTGLTHVETHAPRGRVVWSLAG